MRFDGIILAVLALIARAETPLSERIVITGVAILVVLSIACCICVIDVSWRFLGIAVPSPGVRQVDQELQELRKVLYFREGAYRWAWILSGLAMILIFIGGLLLVFSR
jgi:hypothetical protein